jgi:hypothetical protein
MIMDMTEIEQTITRNCKLTIKSHSSELIPKISETSQILEFSLIFVILITILIQSIVIIS